MLYDMNEFIYKVIKMSKIRIIEILSLPRDVLSENSDYPIPDNTTVIYDPPGDESTKRFLELKSVFHDKIIDVNAHVIPTDIVAQESEKYSLMLTDHDQLYTINAENFNSDLDFPQEIKDYIAKHENIALMFISTSARDEAPGYSILGHIDYDKSEIIKIDGIAIKEIADFEFTLKEGLEDKFKQSFIDPYLDDEGDEIYRFFVFESEKVDFMTYINCQELGEFDLKPNQVMFVFL